MKKILVLEDEANIRSFVVINLNRAGYETIEAGSGEEALEQLRLNPDVGVALLDIMLPDMDGFEVCRRIRAGNSKIGIIMLTARTQEMDKVTGFMTGADDYVTKPFSPAELTARIDALYRRIGGDVSDDGVISQPPFVLNTRRPAHQAHPGGVCHHQALHGKPRQSLGAGRDPAHGLGRGLSRRTKNRRRKYPPPAGEDRGRAHQSHLHHHHLGLRLQVGSVSAAWKNSKPASPVC